MAAAGALMPSLLECCPGAARARAVPFVSRQPAPQQQQRLCAEHAVSSCRSLALSSRCHIAGSWDSDMVGATAVQLVRPPSVATLKGQ